METTAKKQISEKQLSAIRAKREELKALSFPIRMLVKDGRYDSINEGLADMYAEQGHTELNTIHQWNAKGFWVKKGEKALLLWGKPKALNKQQEQEQQGEDDENDSFFPICFVFSQKQIERRAA